MRQPIQLMLCVTALLCDSHLALATNLAQPYPLPLIASGWPVPADRFRFMVSVQLGGGHYCAGTLIKADWVLTSARCVEHHQAGAVVRSGHRLQSQPGRLLSVKQILRHPLYQPHRLTHDIALLQLADSAPLDVQPLQLPTAAIVAQLLYPGVYLASASWGAMTERGEAADELQQQSLPLQDHHHCNQPEAYNGAVLPSMLCTGFASDTADDCVADSGAPLIGRYQGVDYHLGVASFGRGCAQAADLPAFANVSTEVAADAPSASNSASYTIFSSSWFYLDWITTTLSAHHKKPTTKAQPKKNSGLQNRCTKGPEPGDKKG